MNLFGIDVTKKGEKHISSEKSVIDREPVENIEIGIQESVSEKAEFKHIRRVNLSKSLDKNLDKSSDIDNPDKDFTPEY